jgi:NTE family protein
LKGGNVVALRRISTILILTFGLGALAGCQTLPPPIDDGAERSRPKIALVLGGGAARGFAHIGVIRVLEQEKIPVDLVVGTSVGSLIGSLYAQHGNSFELEWTAFTLTKDDLLDYAILGATMGPVKGDRLEEFVKKNTKTANIEHFKIPFAAVAADLNRGSRVVLDQGPVARAVRASCAIPGVFQPVEHQGRLLVDGGTVDNLPVSVARQKGADIVIAVDISQNVTNFNITNLVDVTLQAVNIMFAENVGHGRREANVLITPAVGNVSMMDFSQKKQMVQAGIEAARLAVPAVHQAVDAWLAKRGPVAAP